MMGCNRQKSIHTQSMGKGSGAASRPALALANPALATFSTETDRMDVVVNGHNICLSKRIFQNKTVEQALEYILNEAGKQNIKAGWLERRRLTKHLERWGVEDGGYATEKIKPIQAPILLGIDEILSQWSAPEYPEFVRVDTQERDGMIEVSRTFLHNGWKPIKNPKTDIAYFEHDDMASALELSLRWQHEDSPEVEAFRSIWQLRHLQTVIERQGHHQSKDARQQLKARGVNRAMRIHASMRGSEGLQLRLSDTSYAYEKVRGDLVWYRWFLEQDQAEAAFDEGKSRAHGLNKRFPDRTYVCDMRANHGGYAVKVVQEFGKVRSVPVQREDVYELVTFSLGTDPDEAVSNAVKLQEVAHSLNADRLNDAVDEELTEVARRELAREAQQQAQANAALIRQAIAESQQQ